MKFSLWNFRDWIEKEGISLSYRISDNTAAIEHICFGEPARKQLASTAFVTDAGRLPDCSGFRSALCFGNNRLLFPVASQEQIMNLCLNMMDHYDQLEESFYTQISCGKSVSELLSFAAEALGFPLAYLSNEKATPNYSAGWKLSLTDQKRADIIRKIKKTRADLPCYYYSAPDAFPGTIVGITSFTENHPQSYLLLYDEAGRFKPGDLHIFSSIEELLKSSAAFQGKQQVQAQHTLADWYREALSADQQNADPTLLAQIKWKEEDYYQIACVTASGNNMSELPDFLQAISNNEHCCLMTSEGLSVLIHLGSSYPEAGVKGSALFRSRLKQTSMQVGYSLPFHYLSRVDTFYQQSIYALLISKTTRSKNNSLDLALAEHLLKKCRSLPETQPYIHPDIQTLLEIEDQEKEPLLETLYAYLILGRSASHAAQLLFIHRNTLRARLEKIQRYLSFSIEDYEDIEHILISLIIAKTPDKMM